MHFQCKNNFERLLIYLFYIKILLNFTTSTCKVETKQTKQTNHTHSFTMKNLLLKAMLIGAMLPSAAVAGPGDGETISNSIDFATKQIGKEITVIQKAKKPLNPVTMNNKGEVSYCGYYDWRSGFFPGSLWYLYELTGDEAWAKQAEYMTASIEQAKNLTSHHDVGFIINCSYGNGLRLKNVKGYKDVMVQAAKSLSTRFRPGAGVIQSWNVNNKGSWQSKKNWECPVIIDNMMNLELMFKASQLSGDSTYYRIAVSHADQTLKNQFRPDGSCYHVVDYALRDGAVRNKQTAQGYADESVWSRGQAWAVYGYTMCYRYTRFDRYLQQARKTLNFMLRHPRMPKDLVPYWDMDAPKIPNEPRDVSSAAVMASALYELMTLDMGHADEYKATADRIMKSLASDAYRPKLGEGGNFLLLHSVGSIPHGSEIDKPLNYADYYYLEALSRKAYAELYFQKKK